MYIYIYIYTYYVGLSLILVCELKPNSSGSPELAHDIVQ